MTITKIQNRDYNFRDSRDDKYKVNKSSTKKRNQRSLERNKMAKVKQNVSILKHVNKFIFVIKGQMILVDQKLN